jgi:leucine-rich repeats and immunoglobulin-like domains protein 1/3
MRHFATLVAVFCWQCFTNSTPNTTNKQVSCENVEHRSVPELKTSFLSCMMNTKTSIDLSGYEIGGAVNQSIEGVFFDGNKNINHLPIKVSEKFPNLVSYSSCQTNLTQISRENFKKLVKLQRIALTSNRISSIASESFKGLINLEFIYLSKNHIDRLSSHLFDGLNKLAMVNLEENVCVNRTFNGQEVKEISKLLNQNCQTVGCSDYKERDILDINRKVLSCKVFHSIQSPKVSISSSREHVTELLLDYNDRIHFLPINVYKTFPNIYSLSSFRTSLTTICKENFVNLIKLEYLSLTHNSISHVAADSFEGLINLKLIWLNQNRIAKLEPKTFDNLKALEKLDLTTNLCIDEEFRKPKAGDIFLYLLETCTKKDPPKKLLVPITEEIFET